MASQRAASTMTHPPAEEFRSNGGKATLQSVLSDSGLSLATIKSKRTALEQTVQRRFQDINRTFTDYWVTQAKSLQDSVLDVGDDIDDDAWRVEFATREILKAKAVAAKQKQLWSQVEVMVKEAKNHDDKFWDTWQNSLDQLAAPSDKTDRLSMTSHQRVKASHHSRRGERLTRATVNRLAPKGSVAFTTNRVSSHLEPESLRPSALSGSDGPTKSATDVAIDNYSSFPGPLPSSNSPAQALSAGTKNKTERLKKKNRPSRRVAARSSIKPPIVTAPKPIKKRALEPAAKVPLNHDPVTDPKPGQLYQAYYHSADVKERGWYMGTVLPWKSSDWADKMLIDISMRDMDLLSEWPDCCEPGYTTKVTFVDGNPVETKELTCIERWMPGFEDGGLRVADRRFLFLFFEDRPKRLGCLKIDPSEPMTLLKVKPIGGEPVAIDWVDAKHLRLNIHDGDMIWGSRTAEKYKIKLDHVARLKEQQTCVASIAPNSQEHFGARAGVVKYPLARGEQQHTKEEDTQAKSVAAARNVDNFIAINQPDLARPLEIGSYVVAPAARLEKNAAITSLFNASLPGAPSGQQRQSQDQERNANPSTLSPIQMDIDEAYEEPQTYTKRKAGKRSLSNDMYDEGLGMDYDLNLHKSTTQISHSQTSIAGQPPYKMPRLGEYDIPGLRAGGLGFRLADVGYVNADVSIPRPGPAASVPTLSTPTSTSIKSVSRDIGCKTS